jgi:hypothetical protein
MRTVIVPNAILMLFLAGCQRDPETPASTVQPNKATPAVSETRVLKVQVLAGGEITADGQPVTLEELAARVADLKQANGEVWYYREMPMGEPHPIAGKVIGLFIDNRLLIRLSVKPDFAEVAEGVRAAQASKK